MLATSYPHFRLGIDDITALIPYGDELRRHRKILHEGLRKEVMPLYHDKHTEKVYLMINRLLIKPEDFASHCKWCLFFKYAITKLLNPSSG